MDQAISTTGLLERLDEGPVICAEGYLFEFERRGYLQAGAFVPEIVLEHPELVEQIHREFVHAGSDVVEAFTYYGHREKLRIVGKEDLLEPLNRDALRIASTVARETGTLAAGNLCNTNAFFPDDERRGNVRAMFEEQMEWIVEAGMDFVIGETFSYVEEALIALDVIREAKLPAVMTLAIHRAPEVREGHAPDVACRMLEEARGRPPGALPHHRGRAQLPVAHGPRLRLHPRRAALPHGARPVHVQPLRDRPVRHRGAGGGHPLHGRLLRQRGAPHAQHGRGTRPDTAGEPLQRRHEQALVPRRQ
jgi:betaine-homocysteine S-methyltransferase